MSRSKSAQNLGWHTALRTKPGFLFSLLKLTQKYRGQMEGCMQKIGLRRSAGQQRNGNWRGPKYFKDWEVCG
jgi:hypothetical protein